MLTNVIHVGSLTLSSCSWPNSWTHPCPLPRFRYDGMRWAEASWAYSRMVSPWLSNSWSSGPTTFSESGKFHQIEQPHLPYRLYFASVVHPLFFCFDPCIYPSTFVSLSLSLAVRLRTVDNNTFLCKLRPSSSQVASFSLIHALMCACLSERPWKPRLFGSLISSWVFRRLNQPGSVHCFQSSVRVTTKLLLK